MELSWAELSTHDSSLCHMDVQCSWKLPDISCLLVLKNLLSVESGDGIKEYFP